MTRRVQACLQMQGGHFFATFVKVIETENSLYLMNEDRCNIYLYDFFSLFLGVQSAPKVGPTRNTLYKLNKPSYLPPSHIINRINVIFKQRRYLYEVVRQFLTQIVYYMSLLILYALMYLSLLVQSLSLTI